VIIIERSVILIAKNFLTINVMNSQRSRSVCTTNWKFVSLGTALATADFCFRAADFSTVPYRHHAGVLPDHWAKGSTRKDTSMPHLVPHSCLHIPGRSPAGRWNTQPTTVCYCRWVSTNNFLHRQIGINSAFLNKLSWRNSGCMYPAIVTELLSWTHKQNIPPKRNHWHYCMSGQR